MKTTSPAWNHKTSKCVSMEPLLICRPNITTLFLYFIEQNPWKWHQPSSMMTANISIIIILYCCCNICWMFVCCSAGVKPYFQYEQYTETTYCSYRSFACQHYYFKITDDILESPFSSWAKVCWFVSRSTSTNAPNAASGSMVSTSSRYIILFVCVGCDFNTSICFLLSVVIAFAFSLLTRQSWLRRRRSWWRFNCSCCLWSSVIGLWPYAANNNNRIKVDSRYNASFESKRQNCILKQTKHCITANNS